MISPYSQFRIIALYSLHPDLHIPRSLGQRRPELGLRKFCSNQSDVKILQTQLKKKKKMHLTEWSKYKIGNQKHTSPLWSCQFSWLLAQSWLLLFHRFTVDPSIKTSVYCKLFNIVAIALIRKDWEISLRFWFFFFFFSLSVCVFVCGLEDPWSLSIVVLMPFIFVDGCGWIWFLSTCSRLLVL